MSYFEFPHTRNYDGDLGYIIKKLNELKSKYDTFMEYNQIKFAPDEWWDINKTYNAWNLVWVYLGETSATLYMSIKPVPYGIQYTNEEYWQPILPFHVDGDLDTQSYNPVANAPVSQRLNTIGSGLTTETALRISGDDALSNAISALSTSIQTSLSGITDAIEASNALIAQLNTEITSQGAQIDNLTQTITPGSTSGDAEIIDVRTSAGGFSYNTAGDAVRGQIESLNNAIGVNVIKSVSSITKADYFISNSGYEISNTAFDIYGYINLNRGETITVYAEGYNDSVAIISLTDSLGSFYTPVAVSDDSTPKNYSYTAIDNCYVALCSKNSTTPNYSITINPIIDSIENIAYDREDISFSVTSDYYIRYDGQIMESSNWAYSEPIQLIRGNTIVVNGRGYLEAVSMISTCDESGNNITPMVISIDSDQHIYTFTAPEDCFVIVCYRSNYFNEVYYYSSTSLYSINNRVTNLEDKKIEFPLNILSAFSNITCCGDSLTYSQVYTGENTQRKAYRSYPQILASLIGSTVVELATPGYTATTWYHNYKNDISSKTNQLAIIYLGTNEGLTETVDSDADPNVDPADWADTNTGNYCKMVNDFINANARVLIIKCYATSGTGSADIEHTNNALVTIASRFGCAIVDNPKLVDNKYHEFPDGTGYNGTHYNDFGYAAFTNQLINNVAFLDFENMIKIIPE